MVGDTVGKAEGEGTVGGEGTMREGREGQDTKGRRLDGKAARARSEDQD